MATRNDYLLLAEMGKRILALRKDPRAWIEANLQIRSKDRRIIPLRLNGPQTDYYEHRTSRSIILKARQVGVTTLITALFFSDCLTRPNTISVLVAHDLESAERIFRIIKLFWDKLPEQEKSIVGAPQYENRREFLWPKLGSAFFVGTAGSVTFGRGQTINNLHCCEFAFWPRAEESMATLLEAVPADGRVVVESTANGVAGSFHSMWRAAVDKQSEFKAHFFPWWMEPRYRIGADGETEPLGTLSPEEQALMAQGLDEDQVRWRRSRQRELRERFLQEYPEDDVTAFLTTGRCCCDVQALRQTLQAIAGEPKPRKISALTKGEDSLSFAPAQLLAWGFPQRDRLYVIGADVGEGLPGGDASCAQVLERESGEQVAELHGRIPPDRFAHVLDRLGRWYNTAMLGVERNNHGHSTLNTLRNVCRYPRLYYYMRYDRTAHTNKPVLGWPTDQATKPILVDDLAAAISGGNIVIHSPGLVDECLTFVSKPGGAQEAEEGKFDDRFMAMGIAWQVRKRAPGRMTTERPAGW